MPIEMPEGARLLELDAQKLQTLWDNINNIPGILDDFHKNRPDLFVQELQASDSVWLERTDGNGILYLTSVVKGLSAYGHILYWDKRLRGREHFTLDTLKWLMQVIPLQKVNVFLPDYSKAAHHFVQRMGFKKEGVLRRWSISQGKPYDMLVYGILAEEAMAMNVQPQEETDGLRQQTESSGRVGPGEPGVRLHGDEHAEPVHVGAERTGAENEHTGT